MSFLFLFFLKTTPPHVIGQLDKLLREVSQCILHSTVCTAYKHSRMWRIFLSSPRSSLKLFRKFFLAECRKYESCFPRWIVSFRYLEQICLSSAGCFYLNLSYHWSGLQMWVEGGKGVQAAVELQHIRLRTYCNLAVRVTWNKFLKPFLIDLDV